MIPDQRDRDIIQSIGQLQRQVDELRSVVVGRWGRVPTTPDTAPPDGSIWIDPALPAIKGRANGATFTAGFGDRTGVILGDTAQTITTATYTSITWGTETSDPDGWHAPAASAVVVPAGKAGRYAITFRGIWATDPVDAKASLLINGTHYGSAAYLAWYNFQNLLNFSCVTLADGDSLVFSVYHAAGANRNITSTLEIAWIGA